MRRLLYVLIGLAVLVLALFGLGYGALHSSTVHQKIEAALTSALGQPVELGGFGVALFPTPALDVRAVRIGGADANSAPGLSLASLHVVPEVKSFLPGRTLTIDHVELRGLTIALRKDKTGKWLLPVAPVPAGGGGTGRAGGAPPVNLRLLQVRDGRIRIVDDSLTGPKGEPTVSTISNIAADLEAAGGDIKAPHFTGTLGRTTVTGAAEAGPKGASLHLASESIESADLPALFALAAMRPYPGLAISGKAPFELNTTVAPDLKTFVATGKAAIEHVKLGTLALDDMSSEFRFAKGVFTLSPFTFTFFGGKQQGAVAIDLSQPVPVYSIKSSLSGLDVNRALSATTTMKDFLLGSANVTTDVRGSGSSAPAIQRSLAGTIKFQLTNGVIKNFPLLARVNQALGITEGNDNDTKFESLSGTAAIGGGKAKTNDLLVKAGELSMNGGGVLGFDQSLDFKLHAVMSAAKSQQLVGKLGPLGRLQNAQGEIVVPVTVTGTTRAPKYGVDVGSVVKKQAKEEIQKGLIKLFQKN
ncbi:MAG: AsmA family protein [Deltaproteobacteria bacterium]